MVTAEQAAKLGLLEEWQSAASKKFARLASKRHAEDLLASKTNELREFLKEKGWSERRMEKSSGLSRRCWRRILCGELRGRKAIRKLEAALARLKAS